MADDTWGVTNRVYRRLGWSYQRPVGTALERDAKAIQQ